jgi:hypothetical protein
VPAAHVAPPHSEPEEDDISEDLDAAMRSLQALTTSKASACTPRRTATG